MNVLRKIKLTGVALHRAKRLWVSNEHKGEVIQYLDENGAKTDDHTKAATAIILLDNGLYISEGLDPYVPETIH